MIRFWWLPLSTFSCFILFILHILISYLASHFLNSFDSKRSGAELIYAILLEVFIFREVIVFKRHDIDMVVDTRTLQFDKKLWRIEKNRHVQHPDTYPKVY